MIVCTSASLLSSLYGFSTTVYGNVLIEPGGMVTEVILTALNAIQITLLYQMSSKLAEIRSDVRTVTELTETDMHR